MLYLLYPYFKDCSLTRFGCGLFDCVLGVILLAVIIISIVEAKKKGDEPWRWDDEDEC